MVKLGFKMTINIFRYIYIGENAHWDIYAPPLANHYTKKFFIFIFHFRCILLQISHKKCFFINISILGRSGVNSLHFTGISYPNSCKFSMSCIFCSGDILAYTVPQTLICVRHRDG